MNTKALAILASWGRSFLAAFLSSLFVSGINNITDPKAITAALTSAVIAVLPVIIRFLNPKDGAFGLGSGPVSSAPTN
jgi:hypothetical protein